MKKSLLNSGACGSETDVWYRSGVIYLPSKGGKIQTSAKHACENISISKVTYTHTDVFENNKCKRFDETDVVIVVVGTETVTAVERNIYVLSLAIGLKIHPDQTYI